MNQTEVDRRFEQLALAVEPLESLEAPWSWDHFYTGVGVGIGIAGLYAAGLAIT